MSTEGWLIAVDRGGTFTDVVAHGPSGEVRSGKLLARDGADVSGIARVLGLTALPPGTRLRVGTTVATNALLTASGAPTALLVTEGFGDLPWIGHQARPSIFALDVAREPMLTRWVVQIPERVLADGSIDREFPREFVRESLRSLRSEGAAVLVVAFAHAVTNPAHELEVERLAAGLGFEEVVLSHRVVPVPGLVDRTEAASIDGALTPVVRSFVSRVSNAMPGTHARFMTSDGALAGGGRFRGANALLSGPAGGAAACARVGRELGIDAVIGFDMGGTSTDVCRWAGQIERREHSTIAGRRVPLPGVDVLSVAAGGGSRLTVRDGRAQVGPSSVGAEPGPASYSRGGQAAVTDANVVLGRVQPRWSPRVFGPGGDEPLSRERAVAAVAAEAGVDPGDARAVLDAAAGFVAVADQAMSEAISVLSTHRGNDPAAHALLALGGAGPQHACSIAELLGMRRVVLHPLAGVLSAWGILGASCSARATAPVGQPWTPALPTDLAATEERLGAEVRGMLREDGVEGEPALTRVWAMRYLGTQAVLEVADAADFGAQHERLFGFRRDEQPIEVLTLTVVGSTPGPALGPTPPVDGETQGATPLGEVRLHVPRHGARAEHPAPVFAWADLPAGLELTGPALIVRPDTTLVLDPGWSLRVLPGGVFDLRHDGASAGSLRAPTLSEGPDPVGLELISRRLMGIAERMGESLRKVAMSTNIRERLDFSCAVFDRRGQLLANAPHIPVHLGAMGETVRALRARLPEGELRPGRSWAVNDPALGGSHLPDITVVTPVFTEGAAAPVAWVASRGHHVDVGGISPGSMPPFSTSLAEEGVLLDGVLLVDGSRWQTAAVQRALTAGPHPARDPATVQADLQAQVAANRVGAEALRGLVQQLGDAGFSAWCDRVLRNGDLVLQGWLTSLDGPPRTFRDAMDDGTVVQVSLARAEVAGAPRLVVDFAGTGPASPGNLNAPRAVVRAALLYALRCVMGRDIPLNEGVLASVDLRIPPGSLLDPPPGAAVVGGNVETSQRLVDVLLGALGACAAAQGTMNNLCFGTSSGSYYETIGGGAGATPRAPGADCVQSHMTNTRITDPEVLESRFPVVVRAFEARRGSGGEGTHRGGDGVRREIEFLERADVSLLAQRRTTAPFGLHGGEPGAPGRATLRIGDRVRELAACFAIEVPAGAVLVVETPGGGGFGPPADAPPSGDRADTADL